MAVGAVVAGIVLWCSDWVAQAVRWAEQPANRNCEESLPAKTAARFVKRVFTTDEPLDHCVNPFVTTSSSAVISDPVAGTGMMRPCPSFNMTNEGVRVPMPSHRSCQIQHASGFLDRQAGIKGCCISRAVWHSRWDWFGSLIEGYWLTKSNRPFPEFS